MISTGNVQSISAFTAMISMTTSITTTRYAGLITMTITVLLVIVQVQPGMQGYAISHLIPCGVVQRGQRRANCPQVPRPAVLLGHLVRVHAELLLDAHPNLFDGGAH